MTLALLILIKSKSKYLIIVPKSSKSSGITTSPVGQLLLLLYRSTKVKCYQIITGQNNRHSSFLALGDGPPLSPSILPGANDFFRVTPFLCILPIFWTLYDQQGASWVLQASRMKLPEYVEGKK